MYRSLRLGTETQAVLAVDCRHDDALARKPTLEQTNIAHCAPLLCIEQVVGLWREDLRKVNPKAAEALADPSQYANLFPNMAEALQAESLQVCAHQDQSAAITGLCGRDLAARFDSPPCSYCTAPGMRMVFKAATH